MAKAAKIAQAAGPRITLTPRAFVWYHMGGEYACFQPGIGWFEMVSNLNDRGGYMPPQIKYFHFMHSDIMQGAVYYRFPGSESRHVSPCVDGRGTTAKEFEAYLRRKVWASKTAPSRVFELLGLTKPPQAAVAATSDVAESLNDMYPRVAKLMGLSEAEVRKKYEHLNPGLQAMNLRNRLRARGQAV